MKNYKYIFFAMLFWTGFSQAQDTVRFNALTSVTNKSISSWFSYYEDKTNELQIEDLINKSKDLDFVKMDSEVANLDFTTSTFWIHFVLVNEVDQSKELVFEMARPITNFITLYEVSKSGNEISMFKSGDGINFKDKQVKKNKSLFRLYLAPNETKEMWLSLSSDGEIISLPMIFWDKDVFDAESQKFQFFSGIFYGIFIFVFIIYLTFYLLLRELSFLLYIVYVLFSGFLQFSLDGYAHQYLFPNGDYFTQHIVLFVAGMTVIFVLQYASSYLKLKEKFSNLYKISNVFTGIVLTTVVISLIPGWTYEISYPLINGFSLLATMYVLYLAIYSKYKKEKVHPLFVTGVAILILGAIIFILGNFSVINAPNITQVSLKVGTLIEILCLSIVMAGKYKTLQEEKESAQKKLLVELEGINVRLESQVKERTAEIEEQNVLLEKKNEDIMSSIKYAERIQRAILPSDDKVKKLFPESFIFYKPRDIVSGDFYWFESLRLSTDDKREMIVYATADCTGHGVPGAFVSIVGNDLLKLSKRDKDVNSPAEALDFLNHGINETFNSQSTETKIRDGMDIVLCAIDFNNMELTFAGAKNSAYVHRNGELIELKGDKAPVGYIDEKAQAKFINQTLSLEIGDIIYTFSDGFPDQFGGPKGKKYMYKRFKEVLVSIANLPMDKQKVELEKEFDKWRGDHEQLDDILVIGVKII